MLLVKEVFEDSAKDTLLVVSSIEDVVEFVFGVMILAPSLIRADVSSTINDVSLFLDGNKVVLILAVFVKCSLSSFDDGIGDDKLVLLIVSLISRASCVVVVASKVLLFEELDKVSVNLVSLSVGAATVIFS